ncbi:unnamed protein product, partial [Prorocentrum cordatum]
MSFCSATRSCPSQGGSSQRPEGLERRRRGCRGDRLQSQRSCGGWLARVGHDVASASGPGAADRHFSPHRLRRSGKKRVGHGGRGRTRSARGRRLPVHAVAISARAIWAPGAADPSLGGLFLVSGPTSLVAHRGRDRSRSAAPRPGFLGRGSTDAGRRGAEAPRTAHPGGGMDLDVLAACPTMAPPLVVRAPPATLRIWLWALQRAPREAGLPAEVLRSIVGFLTPWFFFDLDAAIAAAVRGARGGLAEVVLQRTWTMPNPTHAALVNPAVWGQGGYVSARVPKRARVVLRAERGGGAAEAPRLRIHAPDAAASCALLGLGEGAQVTVRDLSLEVFHPRVHKAA